MNLNIISTVISPVPGSQTSPQEILGSPVTVDGALKKSLEELTVGMRKSSVPHVS